jgi:hypothetical protein
MLDDNAVAIAKAYGSYGFPIAVWDQTFKPAYDVFAEFRPDLVISDINNNDRAYLKCLADFKPKVISLHTLPMSADIITYGKFIHSAKELESDYLATISYKESEYELLPSIRHKKYKVFSNFIRRIPEYCGLIDDNLKPLIINSCANFIATNTLDCLNAVLLNKNVINKTSLVENMLKRDFLVNNYTTFHAAKRIIDKNLDINKIKEFI